MVLVVYPDLILPRQVRPFLSKTCLDLHESDAMYGGNDRHYLSCGASALNVVLSVLHMADRPDPASILDFGSGAGRVTRWLRSAFPLAALDTCDLREQDLQFCRDTFRTRSWVSGTAIESLQAPDRFDLIWVGSVATHLSPEHTESLILMLSWLKPSGLVIMSFHGSYALRRQNRGEFRYIGDAAWNRIKVGYETNGYGYADYEGQTGYGISLTKPSWAASLVEHLSDAKMRLFSEQAWDGHHDVLAIQSD